MANLTPESAEVLAISGLLRLAGDDDLLMRFSALTGILPNDIRSAANDSGFLLGVLDFFLSHEPDLLAWAEAEGFDPQEAMRARFALAPTDTGGFD